MKVLLLLAMLAGVVAFSPRGAHPAPIGFIGDSITANAYDGVTPAAAAAHALGTTAVDMAVPGTSTRQWLPGSPYYMAAVAAFHASGVRIVHVMLGTNDARPLVRTSPATYRQHIAAISAALHAAGFVSAVSLPPLPRLGAYAASNDGVDSQTIALLRQYGTPLAIPVTLLYDGIHPNSVGVRMIGAAWVRGLADAVQAGHGAG